MAFSSRIYKRKFLDLTRGPDRHVQLAVGGHNVMMIGSPGTGKTMLARRLQTILPPLAPDESLETTRIYSALGRLPAGEALLAARPFRSPHHTISDTGMVGGGNPPSPGAISLAHHGVLFRSNTNLISLGRGNSGCRASPRSSIPILAPVETRTED